VAVALVLSKIDTIFQDAKEVAKVLQASTL
jgi:hypothetical protein